MYIDESRCHHLAAGIDCEPGPALQQVPYLDDSIANDAYIGRNRC